MDWAVTAKDWAGGTSATELVIELDEDLTLRIDVHRIVMHGPNVWFVSCRRLNIDSEILESPNLEDAKVEALQVVRSLAEKCVRALS